MTLPSPAMTPSPPASRPSLIVKLRISSSWFNRQMTNATDQKHVLACVQCDRLVLVETSDYSFDRFLPVLCLSCDFFRHREARHKLAVTYEPSKPVLSWRLSRSMLKGWSCFKAAVPLITGAALGPNWEARIVRPSSEMWNWLDDTQKKKAVSIMMWEYDAGEVRTRQLPKLQGDFFADQETDAGKWAQGKGDQDYIIPRPLTSCAR